VKRELSLLLAYAAMLAAIALAAPSFYSTANLRDLVLSNVPVLVAALGMTLVILLGEIDVSIGSQFALCGVTAGLLAKAGLPMPILALATAAMGAAMGALNGVLIARLGIPSIVVTLATMVILRDSLRWATGGEWVQNLPTTFQWMGLGQRTGQVVILTISIALLLASIWGMRNLALGRAFYAAGSDRESARLAGIPTRRIVFGAFVGVGALTGLAALLNSIRFSDLQSNAGTGLELKTIAAVVVGGASITGGRGTMIGTVLGVSLMGTVGPALTFLGVNAFWEKAIQGIIILAAVVIDRMVAKK
jgi:rhamnose transport system permease protein